MIGSNVQLGKNITWGNNIRIFDNVIIENDAWLGDNIQIGYKEKPNGELTIIRKGAKIRSGAIIYCGCEIGEGSSVGHNSVIREKTRIGKNSYIGALVMMEGHIAVGNYCGINAQCHITAYTTIGDYTFFGPSVVSTNDKKIAYKRKDHGKNLIGFTTEKYVRIGGAAKLLPGVKLGEGCVIGMGSLIAKDVAPYTLLRGEASKITRQILKDKIIK